MSRWISVVVFLLMSFLLVSCSAAPTAQVIAPDSYVTQFENTPHLLIDVRTPEEYAAGFITGSVNIPLQALEARLSEVPKGIPIVVYCRSGNRSAEAATILTNNGYGEVYDLGGILEWEQHGYRITQES